MDRSDARSSAGDKGSPTTRGNPRRPQFSLLTLALLIMAVAAWTAYWQTRTRTARFQERLPGLREIARPLRVEDPSQYAAVRQHELWNDDFRWRVYLPRGHRYRLRLASTQVDHDGLAEPTQETEISPGEHELELQYDKLEDTWRIVVAVDGEDRLHDARPSEWNIGRGSSGGSVQERSSQQPVDQPLVLFRRRFMVAINANNATTPDGPTDGLLLWIEGDAIRPADVPSDGG